VSDPTSHCLLLSDFNVQNFANCLEADEELPRITTTLGPFGQVEPSLIDGNSEVWMPTPECVVVWTQPQAVAPAFADVLSFRSVATETLLAQVDQFAALVARAAERSRLVLVPAWVAPGAQRGWGLLDFRPGQGIQAALARMNLRLAEKLAATTNVFVLDAQRWLLAGGRNASAPKLWFMGKVPFGSDVFAEAARDVRAAIATLRGDTRKLIVVDLDDTLWGGIVGDVGWENLILGGHHHAGEAFVEFQQALKAMTNRGIVLGIVSKNTESVALEAIRKHAEMHLKIEDFAGWRINWQDKAQNIIDLAADLRLGLQSVVFIDDNPIERERVRATLAEVLVPDWPKDPMLYAQTLRGLRCFDVLSATAEDAARTEMYQAGKQREAGMREAGSIDAWLQGLDTRVIVEPLGEANLTRTAQLLNKTNQMNLRTRRMTELELRNWAAQPENHSWSFRVADRLGDSGLTGIASLSLQGDECVVVDYVLSCRVMGRKVEETVVAWLVAQTRKLGAKQLVAELLPTEKNQPCLEFMRRSGFAEADDTRFTFDTANDYPQPAVIRVVIGDTQDEARNP
jgi:FkbH-like protein